MSQADLVPTAQSTLSSRLFQQLRSEIVSGALAPGQKLRIRDLSDRYGVGATPLREALSRLVSLGFVTSIDQRGFRVSPISLEDLLDITESRQIIEGEAFRRSIERGDDAWEGELVARMHQFRKATAGQTTGRFTDGEAWEALHKSFHAALLSACQLPTLIRLANDLYDQGARYRQLILKLDFPSDRLLESHQALVDVALSRKGDDGAELLRSHLTITSGLIRAALKEVCDITRVDSRSASSRDIEKVLRDSGAGPARSPDETKRNGRTT